MATQEYDSNEFDTLASLADSDPEAFETMRKAMIERFIEKAPEDRQPRLRCLQWRIEQERSKAKTPLGACIRLTRMMWDRVLAPGGLVDHLQQLSDGCRDPAQRRDKEAVIIAFPGRTD